MFPAQLPLTSPDTFSRCAERILGSEAGTDPHMHSMDASLKASVERAIWNDDVLRAIEYYEMQVHAKNGSVHLNGHITSAASRKRIETALRSVPGILEVQNHLVLDDKLTLDVAGALGALEQTYACKFFTGTSHGVVSINGVVSSEQVKALAGMCAAGNPNVRAVINHVRVSGVTEPQRPDQPFLQPIIGERIYFLDGLSGVVERVIIDPNDRRVTAMVLLMNFTDPRLPINSLTDAGTRLPMQLVTVPMEAIRYLTKASGFLLIRSTERSRYQDFDSASFFVPSVDWTAPFPYCPQDVLFPAAVPQTEISPSHVAQPFSSEDVLESATFATDDLAG